jgi:eukaryotic-like serine/threonine-protein kinase
MSAATSTSDDGDAHDLPGYDILDLVGEEGLAVIYRARQRSLNRVVAIRTIPPVPDLKTAADCLRWEAAVLSRVQHPHVVSILDCFEHAGHVYLILEYVAGGTLDRRIAGQPQPARLASALVGRLARTVAYIHDCGILHCNLKPRKVVLAATNADETSGKTDSSTHEGAYGIPLLSGFELALDKQRLGEVAEGHVRGTPAYMAPEQAQGRSRDIGPATDVYGLGAILYEMLTGRAPFQATTFPECFKQIAETAPEPVRKLNPRVDAKLEAICHKCLNKSPAERYAGGLELATELEAYVAGLSKRRWFW